MAAAILTAPDAGKAATLTGDGQMAYFSFPIEKVEDGPDGEVIVVGKATDGTLDSDLQIVDPEWSRKALQEWYDTGANVRVQHQAQRDPAGRGIQVDGHRVRARIVEPVAVKLVKAGVLQDFSVGIMNPDIRHRDPRFRHLDPQGKAVNGIITGREDGLSRIGELSLVDRGSNFGTKFAMLKAAADGSAQWVGELTAPDDVIAKVSAPRVYKTVSVDLPVKGMRLKFSPAQLAKMQTMAQRSAVEQAAAKVTGPAAPILPVPVDQAPGAGKASRIEGEPPAAYKAAEAAVYKRDIDTATRRRLASQGRALDNLSYPVETHEDADNAVTLILSGHGNTGAASRMVKRIARKEGWKDILARLKGKKAGKAAEADVAKDDDDDRLGQCPACKGRGYVKKPASMKCGACGGTGRVSGSAKVAACDACKGTGLAGGNPCTLCDAGREQAEALLSKAVAGMDAAAEKKRKVMCGSCGARQSRKHAVCPECGNSLAGNAIPVMKNHDFTCLGCGKTLDKGEKFCPQCGRENPGYLPEADRKIPGNEDADKAASGKDRVQTAKTPQGGTQKKNKAGKERKKKKVEISGGLDLNVGKPDDDDDDDAKKAARADKRRKGGKKGGKGRSPAQGVVAQETTGLPSARTPVPEATSAFQGDAELKAAIRHKSVPGLDPSLAGLHDLTCPAFAPADVARAVPWADFASMDADQWQAKALQAASASDMATAMSAWNEMAALSRHAVTLKTADPQLLLDLRLEHHAAFCDANADALKVFRDATPGPGSFPTPASYVPPGQFRRPYISAGHAAPSPQYEPAREFPVADAGPAAADFGRGYLAAGHAAQSPANDEPRHAPIPGPSEAGRPVKVDYAGTMRDNARSALLAMHDHVSHLFPDICPVSPPPGPGSTQKPAPDVPERVGTPLPRRSKAAKTRAQKRADKAAQAARAAKRQAVKARKAANAEIRKAAKLAPLPEAAPDPAQVPQVPVPTPLHPASPDAITAAVKAATRPLLKRQARQDKALRRQARILDAIAGQRDTAGAPFRGAGVAKTASPAPAGPVTAAQSAEQAQSAKMQRLYTEWRTTNIPEHQEAAWQELQAMLGTQPLTGYGTDMTPLFRQPQTSR